jgi:hypothetical protein
VIEIEIETELKLGFTRLYLALLGFAWLCLASLFLTWLCLSLLGP